MVHQITNPFQPGFMKTKLNLFPARVVCAVALEISFATPYENF